MIISSTEHFGYFRFPRNKIQLLTVGLFSKNLLIREFVENVLHVYYLKIAENNNFNTEKQIVDVLQIEKHDLGWSSGMILAC